MYTNHFELSVHYDYLLDFINLATGLFSPLKGFMTRKDFHSVVTRLTLDDGTLFTIPIVLPVDSVYESQLSNCEYIKILFNQKEAGFVKIEDVYRATDGDLHTIFATDNSSHPGLAKYLDASRLFVGGEVILTNLSLISEFNILTPSDARRIFKEKSWKTIVGFQTRNAPHLAHEYLQRVGLEICDGLFINPLIGWKKKGDFSEEAIRRSYHVLMEQFYPHDRTFYHGLHTWMRYAGPREALFHALIRKNLGCTHFIIGRDHAGIGDFYDAYGAHALASILMEDNDLGITLLLLKSPYYCDACKSVVSASTCRHDDTHIKKISGTHVRELFTRSKRPPSFIMRKEITDSILSCEIPFIA